MNALIQRLISARKAAGYTQQDLCNVVGMSYSTLAKIERGALIGIGAIVLDHAVIGEGAIVAAGSVVLSGTQVEPGSIYAGVPAKFVKKVDPQQSKTMNERIANNYLMYASWFMEEEE